VNIYLVIAFVLCSVRNILNGLFEITDASTLLTSKHISPLYLIVVPALYLYFKSLVKDLKRINKPDLIHFVYPILNFALNIGQEFFPALNKQSVENIRFASLIVFILFYSILSFNVLFNSLWKRGTSKFIEKRHYQLIKNWTLFLFVISSFLFLRILYSISFEKISDELFRAKSYSSLVIIPWFLIYGKILISPEILYGYPKLKKRIAKIQNQVNINEHIWVFDSISISNLQDKKLSSNIEQRVLPYISDIENYVNKERPFKNPKFSFADFAKAINVPASHLNYIFKYHSVVTFVEYKNYCRIKDALELIDTGSLDTLTLEGLAGKVGFSSYNAFFTAFKKQTNLAPKDYLTRQNKPDFQNLKAAF
tara:strand:- start:3738 stop:4835 length:1098 start_codon:yes stop_codon:yes gene_type:complete